MGMLRAKETTIDRHHKVEAGQVELHFGISAFHPHVATRNQALALVGHPISRKINQRAANSIDDPRRFLLMPTSFTAWWFQTFG